MQTTPLRRLGKTGAEVPAIGVGTNRWSYGANDAPVFETVRGLLDTFDEVSMAEPDNRRRLVFLILAASVARTPDVPVPAIDEGYSAPRSAAAR